LKDDKKWASRVQRNDIPPATRALFTRRLVDQSPSRPVAATSRDWLRSGHVALRTWVTVAPEGGKDWQTS